MSASKRKREKMGQNLNGKKINAMKKAEFKWQKRAEFKSKKR